MKKYFIFGFILAVFVSAATAAVAARPEFVGADVTNPHTSDVKNTVRVPSHAVVVSPGLYYLGESVDVDGTVVQGYAQFRYKQAPAKAVCGNGICEPGENANKCPSDCGGDGGEPNRTSSCYGFLAKDAKWKQVEPYVINPTNSQNLATTSVASRFDLDIAKWEVVAGVDIIGSPSVTTEQLVADTIKTDGMNEVYFGSIEEPNAIAVTIVWGVFYGPPSGRYLAEWDQVYDEVDFNWSLFGEEKKMDFDNIVTHELGHTVGLGDLYEQSCSEETMYGYATEGETKKRDLGPGDIAGIQKLY